MPDAVSVVWHKDGKLDRYVRGAKVGISKKLKDTPKSAGAVSRYHMKSLFVKALDSDFELDVTYKWLKNGAQHYNRRKRSFMDLVEWNNEHTDDFDKF